MRWVWAMAGALVAPVVVAAQKWTQESVLGSVFRGDYRWIDRAQGTIAPTIVGTAHVTADAKLLLDPNDPFCWGIRNDQNMDSMRG